MLRKYVLAFSLLALPLATLVGSSVANASVHPQKSVTFTGTITCQAGSTSTITATPGLLLSKAQTVTVAVTGTLTKCSGHTSQGGAKIISGKVSGKVTGSYDCLALLGKLPAPKGSIVWKTKGKKASKTHFWLANGAYSATANTLTYTASQTGSFAGSASVVLDVKDTEAQLTKLCESKTGLTTISLSGGTFG